MIYIHGSLSKEELLKRLQKRTVIENEHWLYTGGKRSGYGMYGGKDIHRLSMWIHNDFDIKSELHVLHKCDIRNCWNPEHLFIGTQYDNVHDMINKGRDNPWPREYKTTCPQGHPLDYIRYGKRYCMTCNRLRQRERRARRKELVK